MRHRRAFTLIELVAVIVVLAILGGIALPKFINSAGRAKDAADNAAFAGINTALNSAYMSHRSTDAPSSQWVTSLNALTGAMESGKLPEGWAVNGTQLSDQRGNLYDFIAETATASAHLQRADGSTPGGGAVASGSSGGSGAGGSGGGSGGSSQRTTADIQALTPAQILAANLTPQEFASLTPTQLAQLSPADLAAFGAGYIALLGADQLTALTYAQFEAVAGMVTPAQVAMARAEQIAMLSSAAYGALTAEQRAALTSAQLAERVVSENARTLGFDGIRSLAVNAIKYLLPAQIALITSDYQMSLISADRRAAFTQDQVQALNARTVSIGYLTDAQRLQLTTAQMASIRTDDIRYAPASRFGDIPPATIGAIASDYAMSLISADRRAAFSQAQVQALNARNVSISYLTDAQRLQLTTAQMASIRTDDIRYAPASRLGDVPTATIGAIASDYAMSLISADRRAAFSQDQVQALNARNVSIFYLTDAQRLQLTTAQMASIRTDDIRYAPTSRLGDIPPATIGAIASDYAMSLISSDRRAAFSQDQVQALNARNVSISYLTDAQRLQLTTSQMSSIRTDDIRYAPVTRLSDVPPATIGAIASDYAMSLISADRRAAFSQDQVQALNANTVSISYLTETQRTQLTTAQMASIRTDDIRYAPVSRLSDIPPATVGQISSDYAMSLISAERRAALSQDQVQALNANTVSISYLTDTQRTQLTTAQMASIRTDDIRYAPVSRLSDIPPATVGRIASDHAMSLISAERRAGLSQDQVQALNSRNVSISYLTDTQRTQLTAGQYATIRADDIRYASASRMGDIPTATIATLTGSYNWSLVSTDRVQALTRDQILAMTAENYGYISARLTAEQRTYR